MIQRKQTLFLLELVFLSIALMFIPVNKITDAGIEFDVHLLPSPIIHTSTWHLPAMAVNFAALLVSIIAIFLYKNRQLQLKACYLLVFLWLVLATFLTFTHMAIVDLRLEKISRNYFGLIICLFAIAASLFAARFINKDIQLLKSADRIR